jgi:hypothetical protein
MDHDDVRLLLRKEGRTPLQEANDFAAISQTRKMWPSEMARHASGEQRGKEHRKWWDHIIWRGWLRDLDPEVQQMVETRQILDNGPIIGELAGISPPDQRALAKRIANGELTKLTDIRNAARKMGRVSTYRRPSAYRR